ncbi:MAG TPA: tetratricopeptide repeat protein [Thermoanaerobaculia bacterium]|nr:tetratricopeptide repeat protein [Thermoanaerobaculia bacterium]
MKRVCVLCLLLLFAPALAPQAAGQAAARPDEAAVASALPDKPGAAYHFAVAKALDGEGDYEGALAAFAAAEKLDPHDPFIHVERARLLARVAQVARGAGAAERLTEAAREVARARALAPEDLDVLRTAAEVYLDLAASSPDAPAALQEVLETLTRLDPEDAQALFALGRLRLERGDAAAAAEDFRRVAALSPENRAVGTFLVEALLKAGKAAEAEEVLGDVLARDPAALEARLTLADLLGERGEHAAALDTLRAAPEAQRGDARLQRQIGSALYRAGDLEGALAAADAVLARHPDERQPALLKALVLAAQGRNQEAGELIARLRRDDPANLALAGMAARLLVRDGRAAEGAEVMETLRRDLAAQGKTKEAEEAALEIVRVRVEGEQWAEAAAAAAELAGAAEPQVRQAALALRLEALTELESYAEALALVEGADGGAEAEGDLSAKRGELLVRTGRGAEGDALLTRLATSEKPQQVLAAVQAYHRLERYDDSIAPLERLLARQTPTAPVAFLLGAAREREGERAAAETAFRRALELEPGFHPALNYLGYMLAEKGERLEEALALVRQAVALEPDNGAYVDSLGWAHFQLGQYREALAFLQRAARLEPGDATIYEHLGDTYRALGRAEDALQVYRRALALDDENAEKVREKLRGLETARP